MGEVIIKVPEDVKEVIDLGIPYKRVKEKIEELEREETERLINETFNTLPKREEIEKLAEQEWYEQ